MNRKGYSYDSYIQESIYETNPFLLNHKEIQIIEYASFFGAIEIVKFLVKNQVMLVQSMWEYSVHSESNELIQYLEDNKIIPRYLNYKIVLKESIKCHLSDVSRYIINYLIKEKELKFDIENNINDNLYKYSAKYNNYCFFPEDSKYKFLFYYVCEFDYIILFNLLLKIEDININATFILISAN